MNRARVCVTRAISANSSSVCVLYLGWAGDRGGCMVVVVSTVVVVSGTATAVSVSVFMCI